MCNRHVKGRHAYTCTSTGPSICCLRASAAQLPHRTLFSAMEKARRVMFGAAAGKASACLVVCGSKVGPGSGRATAIIGGLASLPPLLAAPLQILCPTLYLDLLAHNEQVAVLRRRQAGLAEQDQQCVCSGRRLHGRQRRSNSAIGGAVLECNFTTPLDALGQALLRQHKLASATPCSRLPLASAPGTCRLKAPLSSAACTVGGGWPLGCAALSISQNAASRTAGSSLWGARGGSSIVDSECIIGAPQLAAAPQHRVTVLSAAAPTSLRTSCQSVLQRCGQRRQPTPDSGDTPRQSRRCAGRQSLRQKAAGVWIACTQGGGKWPAHMQRRAWHGESFRIQPAPPSSPVTLDWRLLAARRPASCAVYICMKRARRRRQQVSPHLLCLARAVHSLTAQAANAASLLSP